MRALSAGGSALSLFTRRFGYLYAAIAFVCCLVALPFQFHLTLPVERGLVALILLARCLSRVKRRRVYGDDFPGDDYGWIQAAALAGLYLDLNLRISGSSTAGSFYWLTYVLVWIIPIFALVVALRDRDRLLLDVSLVSCAGHGSDKQVLSWTRSTTMGPDYLWRARERHGDSYQTLAGKNLRIMSGTVSRHNVY